MNAAPTLVRRLRSHHLVAASTFSIALGVTLSRVSFAAAPEERTDAPASPSAPPRYTASSASTSLSASTETSLLSPPDERRRPWFGGLGYASIAPFFGDVTALEPGLRAPEALGESYGFGEGAFLLGGGGGAVLFGHLWLGGKGFGLLTSSFHNARGEAVLTGGGGAFELGYVLSTSPKMLVIPFFALGGFAYDLEITNKTTGQMPLLNAFSLTPGESKTFTSGFATLEAGLRFQRLLFFGNGGASAGIELGIIRSLSNGPWLSGRSEFTHEEGAKLDGVYARVNIGGGGFVFR